MYGSKVILKEWHQDWKGQESSEHVRKPGFQVPTPTDWVWNSKDGAQGLVFQYTLLVMLIWETLVKLHSLELLKIE